MAKTAKCPHCGGSRTMVIDQTTGALALECSRCESAQLTLGDIIRSPMMPQNLHAFAKNLLGLR